MRNQLIRDETKRARLYNSEIAEALGISTSAYYARLQRDLSPEQEAEILLVIDRLADERLGARRA